MIKIIKRNKEKKTVYNKGVFVRTLINSGYGLISTASLCSAF